MAAVYSAVENSLGNVMFCQICEQNNRRRIEYWIFGNDVGNAGTDKGVCPIR